jgi:hypothetical protein
MEGEDMVLIGVDASPDLRSRVLGATCDRAADTGATWSEHGAGDKVRSE